MTSSTAESRLLQDLMIFKLRQERTQLHVDVESCQRREYEQQDLLTDKHEKLWCRCLVSFLFRFTAAEWIHEWMNRPTSQVIMSTSYIHCIVHSRSADGRVLQTAARRLLHGGRQTDRQTHTHRYR